MEAMAVIGAGGLTPAGVMYCAAVDAGAATELTAASVDVPVPDENHHVTMASSTTKEKPKR